MALPAYAIHQVLLPAGVDGRPDVLALKDWRTDETARSKSEFASLPSLLSEVCLDSEQNAAAAAALEVGDDIEFARIWREARDAHVAEKIEGRIEEQPWLDECAAADQLRRIYS